jgi:2-iminobutanoate/2-iminopropanoate deaminase
MVFVLTACGAQPQASQAQPSGSALADPRARELISPAESLAGASRFGDLIFTAGYLGDAPGDAFADDVTFALDELEEALEASGAGFDTLLKVNVYLTDWDNWEAFNDIYVSRIGAFDTPPRTTVEVVRLGFDAPIEIAAIAHVRAPAP